MIKNGKGKLGEKFNFALQWWNGNDLDLHVECPCGTHIYFRNKICQKCKAHLDIDVNAGYMEEWEKPIENIYLDILVPGVYKFWVEYFFCHEYDENKKICKYRLLVY